MSPAESISAAIRNAASRGEPALVAFLTAGFPSRERFREHLQAVAAGADVVEIGVPFTDPMADGVTIQRSSQAALAQGVSLRWILAELEAMPRVATPLLLMSYLDGVRRVSAVPVCAGFGIRSREQVERLRGHVDGVVIGSALVEVLERGENPTQWLRALRGSPAA